MDTLFYACFAVCLAFAASKIAVVLNPPVSEHEVSIDDGFMITCMVTGWPDKATAAPNLRWMMSNGKPVTSKTTSDRVYVMPMENSLRVFVRNVQKEDSGQWKCELALQGGGKESVSILIKTWKKITFVDVKKLQEPKIGTDAIIECKVDALPTPKITWSYRGKLITATGRYLTLPDGLKIMAIKEEDNGLYTCRAEIPAKFIYEERIIEVRVTIPPEFPSPPSSRDDGVQGKDIKISCRATGKPPPIYTWSKLDGLNKVQLSNNDRITINNEEGTLEIKRLVPSDNGDYMCLASNTGGKKENSYNLDVKVPAKITEVTSGKGTEDGQASISCVATGNEVPEIFFTKVGDPAPVTQTESNDRIQLRRTPGANSVKLELTILSLRASDTNQYTCLAANKYGKDTRNVTLDVQFAPKFTKDTLKQTYTWAKSLKPMKCVVQANPPAVIKWKRNDQFLKNNDTYAIKTSDDREKYQMISLLTVKVELDDKEKFGDYFCEAENTLGPAASRTISLLEAKAPGKPANMKIVENRPTYIRMVINQPTNNGGMPVTKYHVGYDKDGKRKEISVNINLEHRREDEPIPSTIAEVRDLKPSTPYRFEITAENEVGRGLPLVQSHTTKEISKPSIVKITSGTSSMKADEYRLVWETPQTGGLPLKGYIIKYREVTVNETTDRIIKTKGAYKELRAAAGKTSIDITDLLPNRTYQIGVMAENELGLSVFSDIKVKTAQGGNDPPADAEPTAEPNKFLNTSNKDDVKSVVIWLQTTISDVSVYGGNADPRANATAGTAVQWQVTSTRDPNTTELTTHDREIPSAVDILDEVLFTENVVKSECIWCDEEEVVSSGDGSGVPIGAIIAVVIILLIIILIIIDIFCCLRKSCGLSYTIKSALCGGSDSGAPISDMEAGDKAGEPLLDKKEPLPPMEETKPEEFMEKEPDDKMDTPVITLEEPEDTDVMEKGDTEKGEQDANEKKDVEGEKPE